MGAPHFPVHFCGEMGGNNCVFSEVEGVGQHEGRCWQRWYSRLNATNGIWSCDLLSEVETGVAKSCLWK